MPEEILQFFASLGLPLKHFPKEGEYAEVWQCLHRNESDTGDDAEVLIIMGVAPCGKSLISGYADFSNVGGDNISLSGPIDTWMETKREWIPEHMGNLRNKHLSPC